MPSIRPALPGIEITASPPASRSSGTACVARQGHHAGTSMARRCSATAVRAPGIQDVGCARHNSAMAGRPAIIGSMASAASRGQTAPLPPAGRPWPRAQSNSALPQPGRSMAVVGSSSISSSANPSGNAAAKAGAASQTRGSPASSAAISAPVRAGPRGAWITAPAARAEPRNCRTALEAATSRRPQASAAAAQCAKPMAAAVARPADSSSPRSAGAPTGWRTSSRCATATVASQSDWGAN